MILEDITCIDPQNETKYCIRVEVLESMNHPKVLSLMVVEEHEPPECYDKEEPKCRTGCSKERAYSLETGVYEFNAGNGTLIRAASYNGDFRAKGFRWSDNLAGELNSDDPAIDQLDLKYEAESGSYVAKFLKNYLVRETSRAEMPIKRKDTLIVIQKCLEKIIMTNPTPPSIH